MHGYKQRIKDKNEFSMMNLWKYAATNDGDIE